MRFKDTGIILSKKIFKEDNAIIIVLTRDYGIYSAVIKERRKSQSSNAHIGNLVDFAWNARLHNHIGSAVCEVIKSYTYALMSSKIKLYAFNSIVSLIINAFKERDPHREFFGYFYKYLDSLANSDFNFADYINMEMEILATAGYALQLQKCAVTNTSENLQYVSPKSGKAVSKAAGHAFADKLLTLPTFMTISDPKAENIQICNMQKTHALCLTQYFFQRYIFDKGMPTARQLFSTAALNI